MKTRENATLNLSAIVLSLHYITFLFKSDARWNGYVQDMGDISNKFNWDGILV